MNGFRIAVAGLGLVASAVLVTPPSAIAAPGLGGTQPQPSDTAVASYPVSVSPGLVPVFDVTKRTARLVPAAAAAAIINDYWTPSRRAAAAPATLPVRSLRSAAKPQPRGVSRNVATPSAARPAAAVVAFTQTEGKVFYRDPVDGLNHECSGGAINTGKRRIVLTAGHCVHGGGGRQWMQNWIFYPGYNNGPGPAGQFPLLQPWVYGGWTNNSDTTYDYAFVVTQNNQFNQRVVDRVGGNGLSVNPGRPFVTAISYPSNVGGGLLQANCQGTLSRRSIVNPDQQLNCDMRNGGSGGPWLRDYNGSTGLGFAVSNQSYSLNDDGSGPEYGPYYDDATSNLLTLAEAASP